MATLSAETVAVNRPMPAWRARALSRAKPSASSGASVPRTWRISTVDPSRSVVGVPPVAGRGRVAWT
jgi:hypothetical protein